MRWRFTVAAGLVFVALLAWVLTQERGRVAEEGEAFGLNVEQSTKLEIKRKDEKDIVVEKRGDDWYLVAPIQGLANTDEVERMVKAIAELKPSGSSDEVDPDAEDFGLKTPDLTAKLWYNGDQSVQVSLGGETPVGSERYARISGSDKLYFVSGTLRSTLSKDPDKLREKKLAKFEKDDVTRLALQHGQTRVVCVKRGGEAETYWQLTEPLKTNGDEWNIKRLIDKVVELTAEDFLKENKDDKALGLDRPQVRLTLNLKDGRKLSVSLGKQEQRKVGDQDEETAIVFARSSERKEVLLVKDDVLDDLRKSVFDLRDKSVVQMDRDDVKRIEVERKQGMSFSVARRPAGWWVEQPKQLDAKEATVNDLLWNLEDLDAKEFVTEQAKPNDLRQYGLVVPDIAIKVTLRGRDDPVRILIGFQTSEGDYYCTTSESDQVLTVSDFLVKDLPEGIDDLKKLATDMTPEMPPMTFEEGE